VTPQETTGPVRPPEPPAADAGRPGIDAADVRSEGTDLAEALVNRAQSARERVGARNQQAPTASRSRRRAPGAGWSGPADDERDPQPLDTSVERLVDEHGWGQDIAVHAVVARWEQVVGPDVAAHVRVERYTDGEITLRTDSTAWATQMRLLAGALVRRFNEETGTGLVSRVVVLGPHTPSWRKGRRSVPGRGPRDTYG
jgi:predicted nucleic acid-binding Zn ribbon protein